MKPALVESVDDLRQKYIQQIEEDRLLIQRLKESSILLDTTYKK